MHSQLTTPTLTTYLSPVSIPHSPHHHPCASIVPPLHNKQFTAKAILPSHAVRPPANPVSWPSCSKRAPNNRALPPKLGPRLEPCASTPHTASLPYTTASISLTHHRALIYLTETHPTKRKRHRASCHQSQPMIKTTRHVSSHREALSLLCR